MHNIAVSGCRDIAMVYTRNVRACSKNERKARYVVFADNWEIVPLPSTKIYLSSVVIVSWRLRVRSIQRSSSIDPTQKRDTNQTIGRKNSGLNIRSIVARAKLF